MKKKILTLLLALALSLSLAVPAAAAVKFTDVYPEDYYAEAVAWAVENGVTKGTTDTTFSPNKTCTRAEIITFLYRSAGSPYDDWTIDYIKEWMQIWDVQTIQDISPSDFYYRAVIWAKSQDAFEGEYFRPNDPCTRLMAVEFICSRDKYNNIAKYATDSGFSDVDSAAVNWAVAWGVTQGTDKGTFSPDLTCTRGQIVTMLHRYSQNDPSEYSPLGSYVHENGYFRLELYLDNGRNFGVYTTELATEFAGRQDEDPDWWIPDWPDATIASGTLMGSKLWYSLGLGGTTFNIYYFPGYVIVNDTSEYSEPYNGKYILRSN